MRWNVSYQSRDAFERDQRASAMGGDAPADQLAAARASARAIINSGSVGGVGKDFFVAIYGHSSGPTHEPTLPSANDCITVSVTQKTRPPEAA